MINLKQEQFVDDIKEIKKRIGKIIGVIDDCNYGIAHDDLNAIWDDLENIIEDLEYHFKDERSGE